MTRREQWERLPHPKEAWESREPKGGRILELTLFAVTAFFASMGGLVAGGSWIFLTQREATVIRADIANISTRVSIQEVRLSDHCARPDTQARTVAVYTSRTK